MTIVIPEIYHDSPGTPSRRKVPQMNTGARGLRRPSDIYAAVVSIAAERSHQVRELASTTCNAGTLAGSPAAAAAAGFCAGAVGACAIGSPLALGMYLRPPLSERSWCSTSS